MSAFLLLKYFVAFDGYELVFNKKKGPQRVIYLNSCFSAGGTAKMRQRDVALLEGMCH